MSIVDSHRLVTLEMRAAEAERTVDDMSTQIAAQWAEIERLRMKLDALAERFAGIEEQGVPPPEQARPPHW